MPDQIFISYRRDDSSYVTSYINDLLRKEFGDDAVFTDVDNIALGVDFRAVLDEIVSQCQVVLAVMGADWLTARNQEGELRLEDPGDFVRIEIESALARNIPVIPLLVGGAKMPAPQELPESIRGLAFRNGIQIRPAPDFGVDMARLIKNLRRHFDAIRPDGGEAPVPEEIEEQAPAEIKKPAVPPKRRKTDEYRIQVEEEDRVRHGAGLVSADGPAARRWVTRLWLVAILIGAAGGWWYADRNPETVQALLSRFLPAPPVVTADPAVVDAEPVTDTSVDVGPVESVESASTATDAVSDAALVDPDDAMAATEEAAEEATEGAAAEGTTEEIANDVDAAPEAAADATGEQADALEDQADDLTAAVDIAEEPTAEAEAAAAGSTEAEPAGVDDDEIVLTPGSQRQSDASTFIGEGVRLAAIGDHETAIENFTDAIALDVEPGFAYKQRAASYRALGQHEAAISDYDEAISRNAEDVNAIYNRGASHFALQDYAAAIADYDVVIQLDPEFVDAYRRRADAHEASGNIEAALRDRAVVEVFESNRENPR